MSEMMAPAASSMQMTTLTMSDIQIQTYLKKGSNKLPIIQHHGFMIINWCVVETESERLLGFIVNNTMTWKDHLYGNKENRGLIPKLSQRASIIHKLSYIMPKDKLNTMAEGIFFSLLNYCVDIYGNVWGLPSYDDTVRKSTAFRKEDNERKIMKIMKN